MDRNEAIRRIKAWDLDSDYMEVLRELIPELAESKDEEIRKKILTLVKKHAVNDERCQMEIYLEKQGNPKMSAEALREGVAHYGITQHQIDNWLKKYVEVESTEPKSTVCPKYKIGDVIRVKNSNHEFIISRITGEYYHSKGAFIEIRIADDVNGDWEYVRHISRKKGMRALQAAEKNKEDESFTGER